MRKARRRRPPSHPYDKWDEKRKREARARPKKPSASAALTAAASAITAAAKNTASPPPQAAKITRATTNASDNWAQTDEQRLPETTRRPVKTDVAAGDDEDDNDADDVEEEVRRYGREHFGEVGSPYLTPYVYDRRFIDTVYGLRKEDDRFMIGDSPVTVDEDSNIIRGNVYTGTKELWELLTRKKVDRSLVTTRDLKTYKQILESTNGHLEEHENAGKIKTTRGTKYKDIISKLFPQRLARSPTLAKRRGWLTY